jgi:DNA-directed RNA polymerase beta subunit
LGIYIENVTTFITEIVVYLKQNKSVISIAAYTSVDRVPQNGDKFSSANGQKSVVTVIDRMPMVVNGPNVDVILNPHAFARQTMSIPLESNMLQALDELGFEYAVDRDLLKMEGDCLIVAHARIIPGGVEVYSATKWSMTNGVWRSTPIMWDSSTYRMKSYKLILPDTGELSVRKVSMARVYYSVLSQKALPAMSTRSFGPRNNASNQPISGYNRLAPARQNHQEIFLQLANNQLDTLVQRGITLSDQTLVDYCSECSDVVEFVRAGSERPLSCPKCNTLATKQMSMSGSFYMIKRLLSGIGYNMKVSAEAVDPTIPMLEPESK